MVCFGPVTTGEQPLGCLEDRHQRALVVDRSATDHEAIGDRSAERRRAPFAFASSFDGHDVLVGHQQKGGGRRVGAGPGEEQAPSWQLLTLQLRVDAREALLKKSVEGREYSRVRPVLSRSKRSAPARACESRWTAAVSTGSGGGALPSGSGFNLSVLKMTTATSASSSYRCGQPDLPGRLQKSTLS